MPRPADAFRKFAASLCAAALLIASPGLGPVRAAAQVLAPAARPVGAPAAPAALAPALAPQSLPALPAGAALGSLSDLGGLGSLKAPLGSAGLETAPAAALRMNGAVLRRASSREGAAARLRVPTLRRRQAAVGGSLRALPSLSRSTGEAAAGHGRSVFAALLGLNEAPLEALPGAPDAASLTRPLSARATRPAGTVELASARFVRPGLQAEDDPAPRRSNLPGRITAMLVLAGLPGWFLTWPLLAPHAAAGALLSWGALPALLFAGAHVSLALMPVLSARLPRALRRAPGLFLMGAGLQLALSTAGGFWTAGVFGGLTAVGAWGLMRAASDAPESGAFGRRTPLFAYTGAFAALVAMGATMLGVGGWLGTALTVAGFLGLFDLLAFVPGGWRKVPAAVSLLPLFMLALPLAQLGIYPVAAAVALTTLGAASVLFLGPQAGRLKRFLPSALMGLAALGAYTFGVDTLLAAATAAGALGLWRQLERASAEVRSGTGRRAEFLTEYGEGLLLFLPALALVSASWLSVISLGGTVPELLRYVGLAGGLVLSTFIHKGILGAVKGFFFSFGASIAGFAATSVAWLADSKLASNFGRWSREQTRGPLNWWNWFWLSVPWTALGLVGLLNLAVGVALGLVGGALRAPLAMLVGAFHEMGWKKTDAFLTGYYQETLERLELGGKKTYAPIAAKLGVPGLLDNGGFFRGIGGILLAQLALLAWTLSLIGRAFPAFFYHAPKAAAKALKEQKEKEAPRAS